MNNSPVLLPYPRHLRLLADGTVPAQTAIHRSPDASLPPEGYRLRVAPAGISIQAASPAGTFYAEQTLSQLRRLYGPALPALEIEDWPDFAARGVMLDISRDKVPTLATLFGLVDQLAEWKINHLELYTEHTFAYRDHACVWHDASPLSADEIRELDAYCRARFVELVPNQNSFGHMDRWLKHAAYHDLAEAPDGAFYWGSHRPAATLCPGDPGSLTLVRALHAELLPNFSSRLFNVGCDETMELGLGRSQADVAARGRERVYLDFLKQIHASVAAQGRTMLFWGDIILHRPELIAELPRPVIALNWGYEATHPFDREAAAFAQAGVPFYVCPGTSSWNSFVGRTDNALANLRSAAAAGLAHGAIGYLNTDWGDGGHHQYLPVSALGFAAGAAFAWCLATNRDRPVVEALDRHAFRVRPGSPSLGQIAYDLGNLYQLCGPAAHNVTPFFRLLTSPADLDAQLAKLARGAVALRETLARLDAVTRDLAAVRLDRPDATLVRDEFANNARMVRAACLRGLARLGGPAEDAGLLALLHSEHQRLWLARNRPGGLADSLQKLHA
jgi:hexosaminidase